MVIRKAGSADAGIRRWFHRRKKQDGKKGIVVLFAPAAKVYADIGPKPSVQITFTGMEGEDYYGTLLSLYRSTEPATAWDKDARNARYDEGEYEIWKAFVEYEDADGFYFLQEWWHCSEDNQLNWLYRPPETYKILLYFPGRNEFYVSPVYEQYAFDSYYTVDLSQLGSGSVQLEGNPMLTAERCYDYTWEIISLVVRIILTILLELAVALAFGYREKRQFMFLAAVNAVTQIILNVWLNYVNYTSGEMRFGFAYIFGELLVILVEAVAYCSLLQRFSKKPQRRGRMILYALAANVISFFVGYWLAEKIPGIF